jgi:hypothetical protein
LVGTMRGLLRPGATGIGTVDLGEVVLAFLAKGIQALSAGHRRDRLMARAGVRFRGLMAALPTVDVEDVPAGRSHASGMRR